MAHNSKGACSVAATYKPPMLVPRARLPAGALLAYSQLICKRHQKQIGKGTPQGPADLQSAALTTELCTPAILSGSGFKVSQEAPSTSILLSATLAKMGRDGDLEQLFVSRPNRSFMVEKTSKSARPRFCNVPG